MAGGGTYCAVVNGGVQCWGGNNYYGALGDGSSANSATPVQVLGLTSGVTAISAGGDHTCAVANGTVWCWGRNDRGELGDGTFDERHIPVAVIAW